MANLSQEQVKDIIAKAPQGTSPEGIVSALRAKGHVLEGYPIETTPVETPSFSERISSDFKSRSEAIDKQVSSYKSGKQTYAEGVIGTAGEIAGGVGDIFGEALNSIPGVSDVLKYVGGKVASSETVQNATKDYLAWKEQNPRKANLLESTVNIASILPIAGAEAGAISTIGKGAKVAEKSVVKQIAERSVAKNLAKTVEIISPRLTPKVAEEATTQTSKVLGKISTVPEVRTLEIADAVKDVVKGKSFSSDKEAVKSALAKEASSLISKVEVANHPVPRRELISAISNKERPVLIASDATLDSAYTKVLKKAEEIINKNKGDVGGALKGRKEFDAFIEQQFPNLYSSETLTPMKTAIKDIRTSWNNFVAGQLPNDVKFLESLKKQNLMYDAIDTLAEKAAKGAPKVQGEIGTNRISRFIEKRPLLKKAAKYAGIGALGAGGYELVN